MTFRPEQQKNSHKERAAILEKQNEIKRKIEVGKLTKISRADINFLEPRDRIHYSRQLKVIN